MSSINLSAYSDALVVLGTAGVVIPLVRRWGFSPVLGYLAAGALLGPFGLGSLIKSIPALYWITITDAGQVEGIADLGVVFLLFLIGLELSFPRLLTMRRLVFGLGALQVLLTTAVITAIATAFGQDTTSALVLGTTLSLSSTAIVLELLSGQKRLSTSTGRASFAVLLAQDISVIPILMFITIAGQSTRGSALFNVAIAIGQAAAAVAAIVVFGRFLMRPLFRLVAATQSTELFIAAVLFVIVAAGVIANQAGMSMALGAFVAGLLLAETEYEKAIQATVEPFKGLLLGIFFFTVGMNIDFRELIRDPFWLLALVIGLVGGKALILSALGRLFGLSLSTAIETGLLLGPGGEFAFVGLVMAASLRLVSPDGESLVLAATSVTMALTPILSIVARRLRALIAGPRLPEPELSIRPGAEGHRAIVVGYGRVGKLVCELLKQHGVPYVATDNDGATVTRDRRSGREVFYGNATDLEFLKACGLADATGLIITINAHDVIDEIVSKVRAVRPDIMVVARARDAEHARHLYSVGATDAVPETVEASLQLSEAALVGLGVAMGPVIASVHEKRDAFRRELQAAAQRAGRQQSHAMKRISRLRSRASRPPGKHFHERARLTSAAWPKRNLHPTHPYELITNSSKLTDTRSSAMPPDMQVPPNGNERLTTAELARESTPNPYQTSAEDRPTSLLPEEECNRLRRQWDDIQTSFVDEPRKAVEQADNLVAVSMKRVAEMFADERGKLESQWDRSGNVSTEDLRLALQRYRSFFQRLLTI